MTYLLTRTERAELFGLSYHEQFALETAEPWWANWAARHGHGLTHAREWLAAGRPDVDRSAIDIVGLPAIVTVVRNVIAILPAAVAWRLVEGRVQIRCGDAFCDRIPEHASGWVDSKRDPLYVGILVTCEEVAAHEFGHAWCLAPSPFFQGLDAEQLARLTDALHSDVDEQKADEIADSVMVCEYAADRLASFWLGRCVDTTTGHRGDRRRRHIRAAFGHGDQP